MNEDPFHPLFGDARGTERADGEALDTERLARRERMLAVLKARIPYSTVELSAGPELRYVALARSEFSDDLHLVGGGASTERALIALDEADDFSPEAVVDLDGPSERECVLLTYRESGQGLVEDEYSLGIADLNP